MTEYFRDPTLLWFCSVPVLLSLVFGYFTLFNRQKRRPLLLAVGMIAGYVVIACNSGKAALLMMFFSPWFAFLCIGIAFTQGSNSAKKSVSKEDHVS